LTITLDYITIREEVIIMTKEEQLRKLFLNTIRMVIDTVYINDDDYFDNREKSLEYAENVSDNLLYEVKIRTKI
jgi:hypothetical protein